MKVSAFTFALFILPVISTSVIAAEISDERQSLKFHGYFRSTLGFSENGETLAKFQLPGARSKYRFGNEPDTNMELQFDYTYKLKNPENKNANIQSVIMLEGYKELGSSSDFSVGSLAQGYLSFNKLFNDDVDIWIGRRYYQRKSIHIMNHFWLNPGQNSQSGIGFTGQPLGQGKFDLALFRNEDDFTISTVDYLINSTVIDARWHSLVISQNSKLTTWLQFADRAPVSALSYGRKSGYGFGGWMDYEADNLKNTTTLLYQSGAAITQSDFNPRAIREDLGWDLDNAKVIEINNMLTYEALPNYSFQWSLLYRQDDRGTADKSDIRWLSTGIRSIFYLSKHTNIALDAGVDYVDDKVNSRSGSLNKLSIALQLSADRGFKSRPVVRFFVTVASWDEDFRGLVGNTPGTAPYGDNLSGWTIGTQAETWW